MRETGKKKKKKAPKAVRTPEKPISANIFVFVNLINGSKPDNHKFDISVMKSAFQEEISKLAQIDGKKLAKFAK